MSLTEREVREIIGPMARTIDRLENRIRMLESLEGGGGDAGVWVGFTPAVYQGVTNKGLHASTYGQARSIDGRTEIEIRTTQASGVATGEITITVPAAYASTLSDATAIGVFRLWDNSATALYTGTAIVSSGTVIRGVDPGGDNYGAAGSDFTAALTTSDTLEVSASWT